MTLRNIAANALNLNNFSVMLGKLMRRSEKDTRAAALAWAKAHASSAEAYCKDLDAGLWEEASAFTAAASKRNHEILRSLEVPLGGGGAYPLLYFLARRQHPQSIVETGVAAGWSSLALLYAIEKNGSGRLLSSDFPYFRLKNPERFIGVLVPDELRDKWDLDIKGDNIALPQFMRKVTRVDFFHYDSDKSYTGRRAAMDIVEPNLDDEATVLMDDIQDNLFFKEWVEAKGMPYKVFEFEGKYIGYVEGYRRG